MAIVFLQPDGVPITAQAERQGSAALYGGGSGRQLGGRSGFRVGTPADTLTATSTTWTLKPCSAMIDPGASTHQGMYGWASDANVTGAVTASDATWARKDIVYIRVNDSSAGDGSGATTAPVLYLAGTAAASPVAPALPARAFLVGTIDVPKTGAGSPTVTLNPARFVAAGAPLPVFTLAERDALDKSDGLTVRRMDVKTRPTETWDATDAQWYRGGGTVTPTASAGWNLAGTLNRSIGTSGTQVNAAFMCTYTGGTFGINTGFTLALTLTNPGYIPAADVFGYMTILNSANVIIADASFNINPSGQIYIRTLSGSANVAATNKFYISANWNA